MSYEVLGWNCNTCPMRLWDGTLTAVLGGCRMELLIYIAKACSGGHICIMYILYSPVLSLKKFFFSPKNVNYIITFLI